MEKEFFNPRHPSYWFEELGDEYDYEDPDTNPNYLELRYYNLVLGENALLKDFDYYEYYMRAQFLVYPVIIDERKYMWSRFWF
jgi:hypothetical protein